MNPVGRASTYVLFDGEARRMRLLASVRCDKCFRPCHKRSRDGERQAGALADVFLEDGHTSPGTSAPVGRQTTRPLLWTGATACQRGWMTGNPSRSAATASRSSRVTKAIVAGWPSAATRAAASCSESTARRSCTQQSDRRQADRCDGLDLVPGGGEFSQSTERHGQGRARLGAPSHSGAAIRACCTGRCGGCGSTVGHGPWQRLPSRW